MLVLVVGCLKQETANIEATIIMEKVAYFVDATTFLCCLMVYVNSAWREYKTMTVRELGKYMIAEMIEQKPKTTVWIVLNKKSLGELGVIAWYSPWRQYCFFVRLAETIFNHSCLDEIRKFIVELNDNRKITEVEAKP